MQLKSSSSSFGSNEKQSVKFLDAPFFTLLLGRMCSGFSETQTHQIAARKEKQMETMRAALKIGEDKKDNKKRGKDSIPDSKDDSRHSDPEIYFNEGDGDKDKKESEKLGYPKSTKKEKRDDTD